MGQHASPFVLEDHIYREKDVFVSGTKCRCSENVLILPKEGIGGRIIMSKFCKKCGAELKADAVFCPKCGSSQNVPASNMQIVNNPVISGVNNSNDSNKENVVIGVLAAVAILVGVFFICFHGSIDEIKESLHIGNVQKTMIQSDSSLSESSNSQSTPIAPANPAVTKAEQELKQKGVQGTVLASSVGHDRNGYLSLVKTNNNQYQIVTYDTKNNRVGITPYDRNILYFTNKKPQGNGKETVIFNITILNDVTDRDSSSGAWESGNHNLPVYADYKFDAAGNLIPGMLTTGAGAKPSHYQAYFNEQRNVDTINLFLTEMMALQKDIADNKITLP